MLYKGGWSRLEARHIEAALQLRNLVKHKIVFMSLFLVIVEQL